MTLPEFILQMRELTGKAINMVNKPDQETMAGNVIEDIVVKTLTMVRDYPNWPDEAWKIAVMHSPPPLRTSPPPKNPNKTTSPSVGEGTN